MDWTIQYLRCIEGFRAEIRHSNVLGWLFDANENHNLGDTFVRGILQRLAENDAQGRYNVFDILLMDFYSFTALREWKNIDLLLVSEKEQSLIAIENKIGSHEHSNQLNRYREILEREYPDYKRIYIFLTPTGDIPSDEENWDVLTYTDVTDVLDILLKHVELQPDVELMICNYLEIVRRDIVEDRELTQICNKIYSKHKKALDLIFEHCANNTDQITDAIKEAMIALDQEGTICFNVSCANRLMFSFSRPTMDALLPPVQDGKGSWGHGEMYRFWIVRQDREIYGIFEVGGVDVPVETMQTTQAIIDNLKPNDKKREGFRYKRVYGTKKYSVNDTDDIFETTEKIVNRLVDELISVETHIIEGILKNS